MLCPSLATWGKPDAGGICRKWMKRVKHLRSYISVVSLGMVAQMLNPYDDYFRVKIAYGRWGDLYVKSQKIYRH
jgi:hypothetical protein